MKQVRVVSSLICIFTHPDFVLLIPEKQKQTSKKTKKANNLQQEVIVLHSATICGKSYLLKPVTQSRQITFFFFPPL